MKYGVGYRTDCFVCRLLPNITAGAPVPPLPSLQRHWATPRVVLHVLVPSVPPLRWQWPPEPPRRTNGAGRQPGADPWQGAWRRVISGSPGKAGRLDLRPATGNRTGRFASSRPGVRVPLASCISSNTCPLYSNVCLLRCESHSRAGRGQDGYVLGRADTQRQGRTR